MPLSGEGCCTCPFTITVGQVQWTPRWNHSDATLFLSAAEPPVLMRASYSAKMVTPLVAYCPWKQETQSVQTGAIEYSEMRLFVVALAEVSPLGGKELLTLQKCGDGKHSLAGFSSSTEMLTLVHWLTIVCSLLQPHGCIFAFYSWFTYLWMLLRDVSPLWATLLHPPNH